MEKIMDSFLKSLVLVVLIFSCCIRDRYFHTTENQSISERRDFSLLGRRWRCGLLYDELYDVYISHLAKENNLLIIKYPFEPALFLKTFDEYCQYYKTTDISDIEDINGYCGNFFYESSSSFKNYARIMAAILYNRSAIDGESRRIDLFHMLFTFPEKFFEMDKYLMLLEDTLSQRIWKDILIDCLWELDYMIDKTNDEFDVFRDTNILMYKNAFPFLYERFGEIPWRLLKYPGAFESIEFDTNIKDNFKKEVDSIRWPKSLRMIDFLGMDQTYTFY